MSGILRLESLTKGNTLKQGDKTPLKYRLFDADGEKLNIAGKSAQVRLVYPDFLTIGYEKDGLTVAQDDTVNFTIDQVIPSRIYHVEIIVDDQFIFPSRADESKFTVDKSSLGTEANIIEVVGVDAVVRKAVDLINVDPSLIIDEDKLVTDIIANTGIKNIDEYYQQYSDVIKELSENKDYHSLPEIAGARGGFDTLGKRLDVTTAQLAQNTQQITSLANGSPKGTFATLAALQSDTNANTTDGKKSIYLVTADGNWYYWGVNSWVAGGLYQSSQAIQTLESMVTAPTIQGNTQLEYKDDEIVSAKEYLNGVLIRERASNRVSENEFAVYYKDSLSNIEDLYQYGYDENGNLTTINTLKVIKNYIPFNYFITSGFARVFGLAMTLNSNDNFTPLDLDPYSNVAIVVKNTHDCELNLEVFSSANLSTYIHSEFPVSGVHEKINLGVIIVPPKTTFVVDKSILPQINDSHVGLLFKVGRRTVPTEGTVEAVFFAQ